MKTAYHPDTHQRMDGTAVYFWRHLDNQSQACSSRPHAAQPKSTATASPAKARRRR